MSRIMVEVEKIKNKYFYETEERIMSCMECGAEYQARKFCLSCSKKKGKKVATIIKTKQHVGSITLDLKKFSCSCVWGSWWRWGKKWQTVYKDSTCKHYKIALREIKKCKM